VALEAVLLGVIAGSFFLAVFVWHLSFSRPVSQYILFLHGNPLRHVDQREHISMVRQLHFYECARGALTCDALGCMLLLSLSTGFVRFRARELKWMVDMIFSQYHYNAYPSIVIVRHI
jgi:hypothetical protein